MRVLNNANYNPVYRGSWGEYQSFIVHDALSEVWEIRIDPPQRVLTRIGAPPSQSPPRVTITMLNRPNRIPWSVDLVDENAFIRGIGPDPYFPNEKALYCIAFGAIVPFALEAVIN